MEPSAAHALLESDVRYTDQNPKGSRLLFGGTGMVSFHPDRIELIGMVTHRGAADAAAEVALAFYPIAGSLATLEKSRRCPEHIVLPLSEVESLVFDPYRACFAVLGTLRGEGGKPERFSWPFRLLRRSRMSAHTLASELRERYPRLYAETALPFESRRALVLLLIVVALVGVGAIVFRFVYPALGI